MLDFNNQKHKKLELITKEKNLGGVTIDQTEVFKSHSHTSKESK